MSDEKDQSDVVKRLEDRVAVLESALGPYVVRDVGLSYSRPTLIHKEDIKDKS